MYEITGMNLFDENVYNQDKREYKFELPKSRRVGRIGGKRWYIPEIISGNTSLDVAFEFGICPEDIIRTHKFMELYKSIAGIDGYYTNQNPNDYSAIWTPSDEEIKSSVVVKRPDLNHIFSATALFNQDSSEVRVELRSEIGRSRGIAKELILFKESIPGNRARMKERIDPRRHLSSVLFSLGR